jgi:hypothetical protein
MDNFIFHTNFTNVYKNFTNLDVDTNYFETKVLSTSKFVKSCKHS